MELKHLASYLPYDVGFITRDGSKRVLQYYQFDYVFERKYKLILRPLSDLDKLIEHNGEKFVPFDRMNWRIQFCDVEAVANNLEHKLIEYKYFEMLVSWHFDVFGLIEKRMAVNFNEI